MDDYFDIKTLPCYFVSDSRPSEIIEKLNEKRRREHEAVLEEIITKKEKLNSEIEEEILKKSNNLKVKLKKMREDTDYFLFLVQHMREHEFDTVEKTHFQNLSKNILEINDTRKSTVDELYDSLVAIEKKRSEKLKSILNDAYTNMLQIAHKLPFELEEFFEKEIMKINQLTLNNHQHYVELQAELKLQIENDMKTWMQKLYEIKEKFQKHLRDVATQQAEQTQKSQGTYIDTNFSRMNRRLSEYDAMKMVLEFKLSQIYINVDLKNINLWLQDVQMTMACLDRSAKYIVNIFKATIVVIFHRFFEELEDIKTSMLDIDMLSKEEISPYECEIYTPTVEEINLQSEEEFQKIKEVWGQLITYIEDNLHETYSFVKQAAYLWDHHFNRIDELKLLILEDVNNTIEKNVINEEDIESALNISLDKLRQSPTEQKLEKGLNDIKIELEKIVEIYHVHTAEEQKVIEKYREFVEIEIDVLMAEIKRFLTLHPPDEERDPKKQRKRASQESQVYVNPDEELIPHQMLFCRYEVEAVSNWMFGLWEAINHYLTLGRGEIMSAAEEWIKQQCIKTKKRLNVKLAFFKSRYERIMSSIYDKRLDELNRHTKRFNNHQKAIEMEIKNLGKTLDANIKDYNAILGKFYDKKEKTFENLTHATRSSQIRRFNDGLKVAHKDAEKSMHSILIASNALWDKLTDTIKLSNLKFKKSIRLFSEYGNYNFEEANTMFKNINKAAAAATKSLELLRTQNKTTYDNFKAKLEARSSEASASLQRLFEELEHNEMIVDKILSLQTEIRNLVISVKSGTIKLKRQFKNLLEVATGKLGQSEYLVQFTQKYNEVMEQINKHAVLLKHPEPVLLFSNVTVKGSDPSNTHIEFKDFTYTIFKVKPNENDGCFVSRLNSCIFNSFQNIQAKAKEFYSKRTSIITTTKVQPNYDHFMKEILCKYLKLLTQSEKCWLDTTSDFLNFSNNVMNFKKDFLLAFENKFYNISLEQYKNVNNDIMKTLRDKKESLNEEFNKIHSKLKTLYGHPKNRNLLKNLENEFSEIMKNEEAALRSILAPNKEILRKEFQRIQAACEAIKNDLNDLSQESHISELHETLQGQLQIKLDLLGDLFEESERKSECTINEKREDFPASVSGQIIAYMKSDQSLIQSTTDITTDFTVTSGTSEEHTTRDFSTQLQEYFEKYNRDVTDFVERSLLKFHEELALTWSNDVDNILNLYKVKYDQKNIQPK